MLIDRIITNECLLFFSKAESIEIRQRFRKLTRSLSIRHPRPSIPLTSSRKRLEQVVNASPTLDVELPLFDCIFIAGLYHDQVQDLHVPFTRDCYPEEVSNQYHLIKNYTSHST
jgi:hypothetical protein